MVDAVKRYTSAIMGFAEIPKKRAEQIASALAKQGFVSTDQVRSLANELMDRSRENRERVVALVKRELPRLGVATRDELERIRQRVQALEANQRASSARRTATTTAPSRGGAGVKKAPRKRATGPGKPTAKKRA